MSSDFYFFDQYSHASHIGGVYRSKRDSNDFHQALYDVKIASSIDDEHSNKIKKQTKDILEQPKLSQLNKPILPEILTKELDIILQTFNEESKTTSPSSNRSKSPEEHFHDQDSTSNLPKVSLPAELILQLHSTWFDLIKNTNYKYKVWRTKAGEEAWCQHIKRKRSQLNTENTPSPCDDKLIVRRRTSSRVSVSSISNLLHRPSITTNANIRLSRSFSRGSFSTASNILQENLRLLKTIHQGNTENIVETIKNGIHVEFKLSKQDEETKQQIALFDVRKPNVNLQDIITFTQDKCKRLLAETKQKIYETTSTLDKKSTNITRIWFYGDNQFIRSRNNFLASNESNRRQKSKFVLSILRHEIPEKFNINYDTPETKHKCYIELADGSTQIYYPSGRLAVLRLRSPTSTTLFFDDTDSLTNQFLGLVTSIGNVILMQPTYHARFITNNQYENGYLCNGKTGIIEKQFQWHSSNNYQRKSLSINEDNINSSECENTIQLQINSFMQLEYFNPSNILFAFTCQNEEFQFQLGVQLPIQSSILKNLATKILATRIISGGEKKPQILIKRSNSIISNNEKQRIQNQKLSDEQNSSHQLPMMQELILLRKRIKNICHSWLKECRTTLGIMDIDAYHLPDLSSLQPTITQTKPEIIDINRSKSAKEYRPQSSLNNKFVKSLDKHQFLLTDKFESNVIANAIEQFIPHSDTGRSMKQRIYSKKILPTMLPVIK